MQSSSVIGLSGITVGSADPECERSTSPITYLVLKRG